MRRNATREVLRRDLIGVVLAEITAAVLGPGSTTHFLRSGATDIGQQLLHALMSIRRKARLHQRPRQRVRIKMRTLDRITDGP